MASKEQCDLLLADRSTLSVQKALSLMWERRSEKNVVAEVIDIICKFADEKKVFSEIEFYLLQFAHWIVHLHEENSNGADDLSKFALILSQISTHTALQLTFMLIAYLEDYQPENSDGLPNPHRNAVLFSRCAKLLQDVERAVIYGGSDLPTPGDTDPLQPEASPKRKDSDSKDTRKAEIAGSLSHSKEDELDGISDGFLLYKRSIRKSTLSTKSWKKRYFNVTQRTLRCYREPYEPAPIRAIQLQHCKVVETDNHPKYGNTCFTVVSDVEGISYSLRAETVEERAKWVSVLNREIEGVPPTVFPSNSIVSQADQQSPQHEHIARDKSKLTPSQRIRYYHFIQEQIFVKNITNICDRLRFKDRPVRKLFLRRDLQLLTIPPLTYTPLGNSTDSVQVIRRCIHSEGIAFNTKARCPALILFELEEHPIQTDLATFLEAELDKYSEEDVVRSDIRIVTSAPGTAVLPDSLEEATVTVPETQSPSTFGTHPQSKIWATEGSGLGRLAETPPVHLSLITMSFSGRFTPPPPLANTQPESESPMASPDVEVVQDTSSNDKSYFSETFEQKTLSLRRKSDFGHLPGWKLGGLIAKSNDDLRQEVFVMQLLMIYEKSFRDANLNVWLHTYKILSTSKTTGLIELIKNATSLDGLKKSDRYPGSLRAYFEQAYGFTDGVESASFKAAMENYISSMAAYAVVTYLLGIKDRHNGNIMLDKDGHIIHIDFGFVFGLAPGKQFSMEIAPFKLNKEMVDVFGGVNSPYYADFKSRVIQAFKVARMQASFVSMLLELMTYKSNFPAFKYNSNAVRDFRARLFLNKSESSIDGRVEKLIQMSYNHRGSDLYDSFQLATNGIAK